MTNEQFSREYRLLDRLSQGAVVTHHAQAASGAMVMVHFLRGSEAENAAVLSMIDALDVDWRSRVLAISDVDGAPAVVTKFILDFKTLHEWLASAAKAERPASAAPPLPAPPVAEPGEFTRMFRSNVAPAPAAPTAPSLPAEPVAAAETTQASPPPATKAAVRPLPPAVQNLPPNQPGEFTLLFGGMSAGTAAVNPTATPQPTPQPPLPEPPAAPAARAPIIPPVAPPPPAEPPPTPLPRPFAEPPVQRSAEPGDFTRLFGNPTLPSSNPAPPTPYLSPPPPQPLPPAPAPVAPSWENMSFGNTASSKPTNSSPGEYTRLFGTPSPTPPSAPPAFGPTGSAPPSPSGLNWGSSNGGSPGAPSSDDAYLARLNGAPPAGRAPDASPFSQAPPPPFPVHSGPSEFTRIISAPSPIFAPTPAAPRAATPPPPTPQTAQRNDRVLLFSLVGVVVVALILVVVFVLVS